MFWRNNYAYKDNDIDTDYLENKERTNYTYSESKSYRVKSDNVDCKEPYLMRQSLYNKVYNSEEINGNFTKDMLLKTNSTKRNTLNNTPSRRKSGLEDSGRVLRSRNHITEDENHTNIPFVKEKDVDYDRESAHTSYRIGVFNTNTNNSGPDELEDKKSKKAKLFNYDLSGDEDLGSDTADTDNVAAKFSSNNANSKKFSIQQKDRTENQWFQRNMFGLPNEESEETNLDLSGAISGDEQYDIAPYQKSNASHKSKWSKSQIRKSTKSNSNRKWENISCSPIALFSFVVEWLVHIVVSTTRRVVHVTRQMSYRSTLAHWILMPLYLPGVLIRNASAVIVYSSDRLFGTSLHRRSVNQNRGGKSVFINFLFKTMWLLFCLTCILILLHLLFADRAISEDSQSVFPFNLNFSRHWYQFVGNDCMEIDDCCHSYWALTRRLSYCFFSLPARMISTKSEGFSSNIDIQIPTKLLTKNISHLEEYLDKIKQRLENQEAQLLKYNSKVKNFEEDSKSKSDSYQKANTKFSEMSKTIESVSFKLSELQTELTQLKLVKDNIQNTINQMTESQKENTDVSGNMNNLKKKLEEDLKLMNNLINKAEIDSKINSDSTKKLENWVDRLNSDLDNFKIRINEMDHKTTTLEISNTQLIRDTANLKKEIMSEVQEEIKKFKEHVNSLIEQLDVQMSKFEETMNENQEKLSNKDYLDNLIQTHLTNLQTTVKQELNSTLWDNLKNHVVEVLQSFQSDKEKLHAADIFSSQQSTRTCKCSPPGAGCSRCQFTCMRAHQVRKLLKDALSIFAADKIGMADFALESAGGTIATTRCTETYTDRASTLTVFGIPLLRLTNSPRTIIQPSMNPGECWPMKGSQGVVVVQLLGNVNVSAVSIDHIPKSISPSSSVDSAIQDFEIRGLATEADKVGISLGNFTYRIDSDPVQTFYIQNPIETKFVELLVKSNYGNTEYTCIYRLRVHGKLVNA